MTLNGENPERKLPQPATLNPVCGNVGKASKNRRVRLVSAVSDAFTSHQLFPRTIIEVNQDLVVSFFFLVHGKEDGSDYHHAHETTPGSAHNSYESLVYWGAGNASECDPKFVLDRRAF